MINKFHSFYMTATVGTVGVALELKCVVEIDVL